MRKKLLIVEQTIFLFKGLAVFFGLMGINELASAYGSILMGYLNVCICIGMIIGVKKLNHTWMTIYEFMKNDNVVYLKSYKNKKEWN